MSDIATNRKALRDYTVISKYEAGIELKGTEVKSIRLGHIHLTDAFVRIERGQAWIYNLDIQAYEKASHEQHEPRRTRRLLLNKKEIRQLFVQSQQKGLTLPVLRAYWKNQKVKIELAVGRGKDKGDQRQHLKEKAVKREVDRVLANIQRKG
jgi:SsrA-binding protein